jgi:hypothetical protein
MVSELMLLLCELVRVRETGEKTRSSVHASSEAVETSSSLNRPGSFRLMPTGREFFFSKEVNESGRIEAVMITPLISCATARRRRDAGKALARRVHWTPQPRRATCRKVESRHATPAKRDHVRMLEGFSA